MDQGLSKLVEAAEGILHLWNTHSGVRGVSTDLAGGVSLSLDDE